MPAIEPFALSPRDAADCLSVSKRTVSNLIAAGKIKARKNGTRTLVDVASLKTYYASLPLKADHTPMCLVGAPMLCRARARRHAADTRLMARALTWMAALKLALADVILPDETDEIFANEAGLVRGGFKRPIPRLGQTISVTWGVTVRASRLGAGSICRTRLLRQTGIKDPAAWLAAHRARRTLWRAFGKPDVASIH
jgi:excisionase family DNA binding protein